LRGLERARDLADLGLPLLGTRVVHAGAVGVDRDRHRHVLHGELVDRLHAEVLEADDLRFLDRL